MYMVERLSVLQRPHQASTDLVACKLGHDVFVHCSTRVALQLVNEHGRWLAKQGFLLRGHGRITNTGFVSVGRRILEHWMYPASSKPKTSVDFKAASGHCKRTIKHAANTGAAPPCTVTCHMLQVNSSQQQMSEASQWRTRNGLLWGSFICTPMAA